jgi:hypothetical protein
MAMAATRSAEATAKLEVVIVVVGSPAVAIPTAGWLVSGGSSVMSGVSHRLPVYDPALIRDVDRFKAREMEAARAAQEDLQRFVFILMTRRKVAEGSREDRRKVVEGRLLAALLAHSESSVGVEVDLLRVNSIFVCNIHSSRMM